MLYYIDKSIEILKFTGVDFAISCPNLVRSRSCAYFPSTVCLLLGNFYSAVCVVPVLYVQCNSVQSVIKYRSLLKVEYTFVVESPAAPCLCLFHQYIIWSRRCYASTVELCTIRMWFIRLVLLIAKCFYARCRCVTPRRSVRGTSRLIRSVRETARLMRLLMTVCVHLAGGTSYELHH